MADPAGDTDSLLRSRDDDTHDEPAITLDDRVEDRPNALEHRRGAKFEASGEKRRADLTRNFVVARLVSVRAILIGIALPVALATRR